MSDTSAGGASRSVTALVAVAAAVVVAGGVAELSWLVAPVFLALVIVITVHPVHRRLRGLGVPTWAATALLLVLVYALLAALVGITVAALAQLAAALPGYDDELAAATSSVVGWLTDLGFQPGEVRSLLLGVDSRDLVTGVVSLVGAVGDAGGNAVFLLILLLFLSVESSIVQTRLQLLAVDHPEVTEALYDFARSTRRYVAVSTAFGLLVGVVDAVVLSLLGVPLALLWGVLVFLTNYLPYIGFWIGIVPPTLLAALEGGWRLAVVVAVFYTVANFVLTNLLEPRYIGDVVDLSVPFTVIALVFWAWLLGPIGAVLAVPLSLLVRALLVRTGSATWAEAVLRSGHRLRGASRRDPGPAARGGGGEPTTG